MSSRQQAPQQLPLQVQLPDDELFATFYRASNSEAVDWLMQLAQSEAIPDATDRFTWISGPQACGKSHLLHATLAAANLAQKKVMYLPLKEMNGIEDAAAVLEGMHQFDVLCIDDVDAVLQNESWCFELFALINRVTDDNAMRLVMTASQASALTSVKLADLKSRMQWATAYQLTALDDNDKAKALALRARWRGLQLPGDVAQFMLHRLGRDMRELLAYLNELDMASMAQQRRLTIPFVKQTLSI